MITSGRTAHINKGLRVLTSKRSHALIRGQTTASNKGFLIHKPKSSSLCQGALRSYLQRRHWATAAIATIIWGGITAWIQASVFFKHRILPGLVNLQIRKTKSRTMKMLWRAAWKVLMIATLLWPGKESPAWTMLKESDKTFCQDLKSKVSQLMHGSQLHSSFTIKPRTSKFQKVVLQLDKKKGKIDRWALTVAK